MMPFESKRQMRYLYANHPKIAKEFADKTKRIASLPERVGRGSKPAIPKLKT